MLHVKIEDVYLHIWNGWVMAIMRYCHFAASGENDVNRPETRQCTSIRESPDVSVGVTRTG